MTICAAREDHLDVLKYLRESAGCTFDERVCSEACANGNLKMLKYACNSFAPWNKHASYRARMNRHLHILQFLKKHKCPWVSETPIHAAEGGFLACVEFLHINGCQFDERVAEQAAELGHLEVLRYIVEENLSWYPSTCLLACSSFSEYVRDQYFDELRTIGERHKVVRAWVREYIQTNAIEQENNALLLEVMNALAVNIQDDDGDESFDAEDDEPAHIAGLDHII